VGFRRIGIAFDQRVLPQHLLHPCPLDPDAAAVDQAHLPKASRVRRPKIFIDHRRDIARLKGVQVERALDRQFERVVDHSSRRACSR
jgi:hypothetical protein